MKIFNKILLLLYLKIVIFSFAQVEQKALLLPKNENIEQIEKDVLEKELKLTLQIREINFRLNEIVEEKLPEIQDVQENKYSDYYQPEIVGKDTNKTKSTLGTTYYTRATGNWGATATWSTVGCGGTAASSTPGAAAGDVAIICNGHTVTVAANPANPLNAVTVKNGGYLKCGGTGGGANKQFTIAPGGTFTIEAGGTYEHNTTTAASTTVFNGTESFDPASNFIVTKWSDYTVSLIIGCSSNFGNLILNWDPGAFYWNNTGLGYTCAINGNFTIGSLCATYLDAVAGNRTITIGGNLTVNGELRIKQNVSGDVTLNVNGNTIVSSSTAFFYGIYSAGSGTGNFNFTCQNLELSNTGYFYGRYAGSTSEAGNCTITVQNFSIGTDNTDCLYSGIDYGSGTSSLTVNGNFTMGGTNTKMNFRGIYGGGDFYFTVNGIFTINAGQLIGIDYPTDGNYGKIIFNFNTFNFNGGSIVFHSTAITDGRTCEVNISGDANINFSSSNDFIVYNNITNLTNNNAVYKFIVGGNLNISGNTSAKFITRYTNTGDDIIEINGNLSISGGTNYWAYHPTYPPNNTLKCTIGGNVSITGGSLYTQQSNSTSYINLVPVTPSVTWTQTTTGTVSLCNTYIKPGKTVTLTGSKMGDFQSGRTLNVETGATLNCDIYPVTGAGNFTLSNGATLGIGNINGIESSGATGNIQVSGTRTYNSNATYRYYGSQTPQNTGTFATTSDPQIQYLVIDKTNSTDQVIINKGSAGGNSFTITGNLNLIKGGLSLNERTLIVSNGATSAITRTNGYIVSETNAATNNSKLQWNIGANTGAHVFPFGTNDGYYIPVTFNNSANVGNVTISTRPTNSDNTPWATGVTNMNLLSNGSNGSSCCVIDRWWDISVTNPASSSVTFSYLGRENTMTNPNSEIAIQHWTGSTWNNGNGGGSGTFFATGSFGGISPTTTYSVTGTFNEFSPFILVNKNDPLPVELLNLKVICHFNSNIITWQTASEHNNEGFIIQKSNDLIEWEDIGFVKGMGNSSMVTNYTFKDNYPYNGINYYRLLQRDLDSETRIYDPISVSCNQKQDESVYAYLDNNKIVVNIKGSVDYEYTIVIYNTIGKLIEKGKIKGDNLLYTSKERYSSGLYYVTVFGSNGIYSIPVVVE